MEKEIKKLIVLAEKYKEYSILAKYEDYRNNYFLEYITGDIKVLFDVDSCYVTFYNIIVSFREDVFSKGDNISIPFDITTKQLKETYTVAKKIFDNLPDADGVEKTNELLLFSNKLKAYINYKFINKIVISMIMVST